MGVVSRLKMAYAAAIAALLIPALAAHATATPINILALGDSITAPGSGGFYISPLETTLTNNGYAPTLLANEGHGGFYIDGTIPGAPYYGLREHIGPVPASSPDYLNHPNVNASNTYILLMIGTNDVNSGFDLSTAQVQSRMSGLISAIRNEAPLAHLIVAGIVPNLTGGKDAAVQKFNTDIAGVASGSNVSYVNMYPAFEPNPAPLFYDNLHPDQLGGNVMAGVWFDGIQATQATPEPGSLAVLALGASCLLARRRKRS
jgi:hypothetical protein